MWELLVAARIATGLPNWLWDDYYDGIVAGAVATMKMMKGTEWYDPETAAGFGAAAVAMAEQARTKAQQDDQSKDRRVCYGGY